MIRNPDVLLRESKNLKECVLCGYTLWFNEDCFYYNRYGDPYIECPVCGTALRIEWDWEEEDD